MIVRIISAVIALGLAAALPAAVVAPYNDIRLALGTQGGDYEIDVTVEDNDDASDSIDESYDSVVTLDLGWVGSTGLGPGGGFVYGAGFHHVSSDDDIDGTEVDFSYTGFRGALGWGYAFTPALHMELLPYLGLGQASLESDVVDEDGSYVEFGLDANLLYTFGGGFQLGGSLGVNSLTAVVEDEVEFGRIGTFDVEYEITQVTPTVRFLAGYRF